MRLCSAVVVTLGLALAACGDEPPTEEEWRVAASTLCVNGEMELMKTPLPETREEAEAFARKREESAKAIYDGLRDLDAPESIEGRLEEALKDGVSDATSDRLAALDLPRCATGGVFVFEGGELWAEEVTPACTGAVREIQAEQGSPDRETPAQIADELRVLAKSLSSSVPPQEAIPPWEGAQEALRASADAAEDPSQGRRPGDELDRSIYRGLGAFSLLRVDGCDDVYLAFMGEEPS